MIDRGPGRTPPVGYDDAGHGGLYTGQGADLKPHLAYFDVRTQASFVWDGKSPTIEVHLGGYGEPVDHEIPAPWVPEVHGIPMFDRGVGFFDATCTKHARELPTYGSQAF